MWLINTKSLELKEFMGEPTDLSFPRYAILSHTWGEKEVSFQDMQDRGVAKKTKKTSFGKISNCCRIALNEGLSWVWVDTCCIDKTSSAELSEGVIPPRGVFIFIIILLLSISWKPTPQLISLPPDSNQLHVQMV